MVPPLWTKSPPVPSNRSRMNPSPPNKPAPRLIMARFYMRYRRFGRTGWQVSEIGYGMGGMGGWTGSDDRESLRALDHALTLGCNFFDTAWAYGQGKSEQLLGQALRAHAREKGGRPIFVATKIPPKNMKWPGKAEYPVGDTY